jgi:S1-C subfamily serine protease
MASKVWGDLRISGTDPNRPKLGLTFDREKQKGGALIAEIMPNTKASDAGIKAGDTITKFDGTEITNYWALMRELSDHKAGETIKLEAKRGDEVIPIELELLGRDGKAKPKVAEQPPEPKAEPKTAPKAEQKSARKDPAVPDTTRPRPYCGAELDGTKDTAELSGVSPDSPADKAGMKAGDVVTAVDGKPIKNALALSEKIRQHKPGDNISLTVKRGAEVLTLELTLAKK